MKKNRASSTQTCDRCGEQLKRVACGACDGKGYYREWIIFKKECMACSGSGRILRCPNEYRHVVKDLNLSPKLGTKPLYRGFRKSPSPKISSSIAVSRTITTPPARRTIIRPPARPHIPPPWHPSYPNPWHPMHPRNPRNQPFNPLNPNSPTNPNNPMNPMNPNNPMRRKPFK
jgi:hypothetical protein